MEDPCCSCQKFCGHRDGHARATGRCTASRPQNWQRHTRCFLWSTTENIDYHVELDGHYYSVPHALVGQTVELRITDATVEVLHGNKRVAAHALNGRKGAHTTTPEHMPASHRAHLQWTPAKLIAWGERVGAATAAVVRWQMEHRQHPEQGYRSCLGLMRLGREYGADRLEAACARAQSIRSPSYKSIASILGCGLDQRPLDAPMAVQASLPLHENVRGPGYYH